MAAAIPVAIAAVKAAQAYEQMQGQVQQAHAEKAAGYATADANEERVRQRSAHQLGAQRAAAVESGFDPSTGSIGTLQEQSSGNAELDALTERYKGSLNAAYVDQRVNNARAAFKGSIVGAAATLLGGSVFGSIGGSELNSGNSYVRYGNNDLSGMNRGSGD